MFLCLVDSIFTIIIVVIEEKNRCMFNSIYAGNVDTLLYPQPWVRKVPPGCRHLFESVQTLLA